MQIADVQLNLNISLCGTSKQQQQNVTIAKNSPFYKLSPKLTYTSSTSGIESLHTYHIQVWFLFFNKSQNLYAILLMCSSWMDTTLSKITKNYAKESPYQAGGFFVYIYYKERK